jgi:hypothetical protein
VTIPTRLIGKEVIPKRANQTAGDYFVEVETALEDRLTTLIREFNERALTYTPCPPALTSR